MVGVADAGEERALAARPRRDEAIGSVRVALIHMVLHLEIVCLHRARSGGDARRRVEHGDVVHAARPVTLEDDARNHRAGQEQLRGLVPEEAVLIVVPFEARANRVEGHQRPPLSAAADISSTLGATQLCGRFDRLVTFDCRAVTNASPSIAKQFAKPTASSSYTKPARTRADR